MSKPLIKRLFLFAPVLFLSFSIISCSTTKNIQYFQDIPDSGKLKTIPTVTYSEPTIQVDDILTILVETVDPQATAMISLGNVPVSSTPSAVGAPSIGQQVAAGYLVNKDGTIEVPVLGKINVLGLTTSQARTVILTEALKYFKNPTVIVRYANFKINISGEVMKPGQYILPNEKVSVLDALSIAGDLTIYGKRDNVLLIRENLDGTKTPYRINLLRSDIMSEPYYYLKQNDVIYVQPNKSKAAANDAAQTKYFAIAASILTVLIVILTRVK